MHYIIFDIIYQVIFQSKNLTYLRDIVARNTRRDLDVQRRHIGLYRLVTVDMYLKLILMNSKFI